MLSKIETANPGSNINPFEETFVDELSQKRFRRFRYFDHIVIQDVETGRINVGKFIVSTTPAYRKTQRDLYEFKRSGEDYQLVLTLGKEMFIAVRKEELMKHETTNQNQNYIKCSDEKLPSSIDPIPPFNYGGMETQEKPIPEPSLKEIEDFLFIDYNKGYGAEEIRGTYTPIKVFQIIALWADKKHKLAILDLIWEINEKAIMDKLSAYDGTRHLTEQLKRENESLRKEKEELGEQNFILNNKIKALNIPFNQSEFPSVIWFRPDGKDYFQVRYDRVSGTSNALFVYPTLNAKDVKNELMKLLEKEGLVYHFPRKHLVANSNKGRVIEILNEITSDRHFIPISKERKKTFIDMKLQEIHQKPFTAQIEGLIYEYEIIQKHEELIPWKMIPDQIRYQKNEKRSDKGIDAIEITDKGEIKTIVQIKHHRGSYLRKEEIQGFLVRCQEPRYMECEKKLILHNCKLGPKLQMLIESSNIEIVNE